MVNEGVIINFSLLFKRVEDGVSPGLQKKQHTEMFSVANFVSKKCFVTKRFVLNIDLLKK